MFIPSIRQSRAQTLTPIGSKPGAHGFVAESGGEICGAYIVKPNQPALGAHVVNAAFMVSPTARGRGVGRAMGKHCLAEAKQLSFHAMQFNFVVSTNQPASIPS